MAGARALYALQVNQRYAQNHCVAHDIKPDSNATHGARSTSTPRIGMSLDGKPTLLALPLPAVGRFAGTRSLSCDLSALRAFGADDGKAPRTLWRG